MFQWLIEISVCRGDVAQENLRDLPNTRSEFPSFVNFGPEHPSEAEAKTWIRRAELPSSGPYRLAGPPVRTRTVVVLEGLDDDAGEQAEQGQAATADAPARRKPGRPPKAKADEGVTAEQHAAIRAAGTAGRDPISGGRSATFSPLRVTRPDGKGGEFSIEIDRDENGRYIAEIAGYPSAIGYGSFPPDAVEAAVAIALEQLAGRPLEPATPGAPFSGIAAETVDAGAELPAGVTAEDLDARAPHPAAVATPAPPVPAPAPAPSVAEAVGAKPTAGPTVDLRGTVIELFDGANWHWQKFQTATTAEKTARKAQEAIERADETTAGTLRGIAVMLKPGRAPAE